MEIIVASVAGMGRFQGLVKIFPNAWDGSILDVGCRSRGLKQALPNNTHYVGLDLYPPADTISNLEAGLPFNDKSFDTTTALDVLEHTNDIHRSFYELCRTARNYVVVALPNLHEVRLRIKFLRGQTISGKYGLPLESVLDRHRWLFSLNEARLFCATVGMKHGFKVCSESCLVAPKRGSNKIGRIIARRFPALISTTYLVFLRRGNT